MTCAIIIIVKNENRYLDEWINHYKNILIDHIYIIDNNDVDGENLHDIIDKYGDYITYIDFKGDNTENLIERTYVYVYNKYNHLYDWWCFFDTDEFLEFTKDKNIKEYLSRSIFENAEQIHINWILYDDNNLIKYDQKPVQERFTHISNIYNKVDDYDEALKLTKYTCKSIIRNKLNIMGGPHSFFSSIKDKQLNTVDSVGCYANEYWGSCNNSLRYDLCYLKHYSTKSLNEYIFKKYNCKSASKTWVYDFDNYFMINEHTKEKDEYIKNYLNLQKLIYNK